MRVCRNLRVISSGANEARPKELPRRRDLPGGGARERERERETADEAARGGSARRRQWQDGWVMVTIKNLNLSSALSSAQ